MTPYEWFKAAAERPLTPSEKEKMMELKEKYPYFSLPYYVRARHSGEKEDLFTAAAYAADRELLHAYIEGHPLAYAPLNPEVPTEIMEESQPAFERKYSPQENDLFSVVDFDQLNPRAGTPAFNVQQPARGACDSFLDLEVKVRSAKYLFLLQEIREALAGFAAIERKRRQDRLLEDFLQREPRIKRSSPDEAAQPDPAAESSVEAGDDFVSETLARLLLRQGQRNDALRIYRKLCLLFPEKSDYFEAQIKKITES